MEEEASVTQAEFYKSRAWRRTRQAYVDSRIAIDGGICEVCNRELGLIVHHKIWLTDQTCNDPSIALSFDNLRYECQTCHNKEKDPQKRKNGRIKFGPNGEVLKNE